VFITDIKWCGAKRVGLPDQWKQCEKQIQPVWLISTLVIGSRTCQEAETLLFRNFLWEGIVLSLHCKACDVLFVQEMRELGAPTYRTAMIKRGFCFLLPCLRLDNRQRRALREKIMVWRMWEPCVQTNKKFLLKCLTREINPWVKVLLLSARNDTGYFCKCHKQDK